jgi:hypothetical protein
LDKKVLVVDDEERGFNRLQGSWKTKVFRSLQQKAGKRPFGFSTGKAGCGTRGHLDAGDGW